MALPADATKVNLDQASDDPKLARAELADLVDKFNALLVHLGISAITTDPLTVGDGLVDGGTTLDVDLDAAPGLAVSASGLKVDINGTAAKTSPVAADSVLVNDVAGSNVVKKVTIPNLLKGGALSNLGNVNVASPTTNDVLQWNGSAWVDTALGALALLNSVGASQIDANSVNSSELVNGSVDTGHLNTTAGEEHATSSTGAFNTVAGGQYVFWPDQKYVGGTVNNNFISPNHHLKAADTYTRATNGPGTSFVTKIAIGENGTGTLTARFKAVTGSPPYDLGDGEVGLFITLAVDGLGNVIHYHVSEDPVWAHNGQTNIIASLETQDGRKFRRVPIFTDPSLQGKAQQFKHISAHDAILKNPAKREAFLQNLRDFNAGGGELIEIDQSIKNADMNGQGLEHPFVSNDLTGQTIIMLDPVSNFVQDLLILHKAGQSITSLLISDDIEFDNIALPRSGPNGVMIVTPSWKP